MAELAIFGGTPQRTKDFPVWPVFDGTEEKALVETLRSGKWWRYAFDDSQELEDGQIGSRVAAFQREFARFQDSDFGLACSSGTAALEVALKALGIGPGDEVIVPAYTFVATATSALLANAVPIFADIDLDTLNIDHRSIEDRITSRTRAVIPVHFAGRAADMQAILRLADRYDLKVIEDAAHGHGGSYNGRRLGSLGHLGAFSFQASKNMTAGEGGLITTSDARLAELCESFISVGRKKGRPWYEHHRLGSNYRMTEFQGALLLEQLKRVENQNSRRRANAAFLDQRLREMPGIHPLVEANALQGHSFHLFCSRLDEKELGISRETFLQALAAEGIPCSAGYAHPLYRNPLFLERRFYPGECPLTCKHSRDEDLDYRQFQEKCPESERACREVFWLEQRLLLGEKEDIEDIAAAVEKICKNRHELEKSALEK